MFIYCDQTEFVNQVIRCIGGSLPSYYHKIFMSAFCLSCSCKISSKFILLLFIILHFFMIHPQFDFSGCSFGIWIFCIWRLVKSKHPSQKRFPKRRPLGEIFGFQFIIGLIVGFASVWVQITRYGNWFFLNLVSWLRILANRLEWL